MLYKYYINVDTLYYIYFLIGNKKCYHVYLLQSDVFGIVLNELIEQTQKEMLKTNRIFN